MHDAMQCLRWTAAALLAGGAALLGTVASADATPQCLRAMEIDVDQAIRSRTEMILLNDACSGHSYLFVFQRLLQTSRRSASAPHDIETLPARHDAPLQQPADK